MEVPDKYRTLEYFAYAAAFLPDKVLRSLETVSQIAQGKGGGGYSIKREIRAINALKNHLEIKNAIVVDIGANIGHWTIQYLQSNPNDTVFAFEPSKIAHKLLSENLQNIQNVHIENIGLSSMEGEASLFSSDPASGGASLIRRQYLFDQSIASEKIILTTLSKYFENLPQYRWPNIMKIDCEGSELDILKGSVKILHKIRILQFEFASNAIDFRYYFLDIYRFLTEYGFDIYRLSPRGLKRNPKI